MKIVYYDIETVDYELGKHKKYKNSSVVVNKGVITSIAFKSENNNTEALTIGVNCEDEVDLLKKFEHIVKDENNTLVAWNGKHYDDVILKHVYKSNFKADCFDLMLGYHKFHLNSKGSNFISLNSVANELNLSKDDVNPVTTYNNGDYQLLQDYNVKDVDLLKIIDDKYNLINYLTVILETTGLEHCNDVFSVTKLLKSYINKNNYVLGTNKRNKLKNYGGLNFYKDKGKFENVKHFDVRSFYPYMLICLNASSNLNYNNLKTVTLSYEDVKDFERFNNLYIGRGGLIQVKQDTKDKNKYIGVELKRNFDLSNGNGDIKGLTESLLEYKNNTTGALRQAYKIIVNGLYGALDSNYFSYKHKPLSSTCTFMCRYVLYNVIKEFKAVYGKTDSVMVFNGSSQELNKYTADLLSKLGLNVLDDNGDYLIQWELEAEADILFIKDLNNYIEKIDDDWIFKGSFSIPLQKNAVKERLTNENFDLHNFVKSNITDVKGFSEYSKLSEKQKNQFKKNTVLSDKLGLPYQYGYKNYCYYSDDGWVNTSVINEKCPTVNFEYAMHVISKILVQYGFMRKETPFNDNKPKKNGVNNQLHIGQVTNLDNFRQSFKNLYEVLEHLTEISDGERKNEFKLALVGTACRYGYDIRPKAHEVFSNNGYSEAERTIFNVELKSDGYGYKKLLELTGDRNACDEFVRLLKQELKPIESDNTLPLNTIEPDGELLYDITVFIEDIENLRDSNRDYLINEVVESVKYNLGLDYGNLKHIEKNTVSSLNKLYFDVDGKSKSEIFNMVKDERVALTNRYKDLKYHYDEFVKGELVKCKIDWNNLTDYLKTKIPNYIGDYEELLTLMLVFISPLRLIINLIGSSSGGKNYHISLLEQLKDNVTVRDDITVASFYRHSNSYYWFDQWLIFDDISDKYKWATEFSKQVLKKLITEGAVSRELKPDNSNEAITYKQYVKDDWKCLFGSIKPMLTLYDEQLRSRSFTHYLTEITEDNETDKDDGDVDLRNVKYFLELYTSDYRYSFSKDLLKELGYYDKLKPLFYDDGVYRRRLKQNYTAIVHFLDYCCPDDVVNRYIKGLVSVNSVNVKQWAKVINNIVEPQPYNYDMYQSSIASSKSYHNNVNKLGKAEAFTKQALSGIRVKLVKDNINNLDNVLKHLEEFGAVKKVGTKDKSNVYILVSQTVQEFLE